MLGLLVVAAMSFSNKATAQNSNGGFEYSSKCLVTNFWTTDKRASDTACITAYWSVNGTYYTGSTFTYTFPKAGTYQVCMKLKSKCKTWDTTYCKSVVVTACTTKCNWAGMDFSYSNKCRTFTFEGKSSSSGCLKYQYYVFYNNTTTTLTPGRIGTYTFPANGSYNVKLIVKDTCHNCDTFIYKTIGVNCSSCDFKPEFGFKADCRKVKFTAGTVSGATYYWNFGDGSTGSGVDPSRTYVKDGVYKVCLYVSWKDPNTGDYCKKEFCREVVVKCGEPCNLKGDYQFYTSGSTVKFFGSSNNGTYYDWDFGDGTTGSGKDLYHVYKKPGTYKVCVKITDKTRKCTVKVCKTIVIVEPCRVTGDFSWTKGTTAGSFKFKGISTGGYYYVWSFGDGTSGTGVDPSHTYTKPGTYTVCLTIYSKNEKCKTKICKTLVVPTSQEKCILPTGWSQTNTCRDYSFDGYKITGSNGTIYTNPCHKYSWSFGDGTYASGKAVTHKYATNGSYTVCLKVIDTCRKCDTLICHSMIVNCAEKCNWKAKYPNYTTFSAGAKCLVISAGLNTANGPCIKQYYSIAGGSYTSNGKTFRDFTVGKPGNYVICIKLVDTCTGCDTTLCKEVAVTGCCNWTGTDFTITTNNDKCLYTFTGATSSKTCLKYEYTISGGTSGASVTKTGRVVEYTMPANGTYKICYKVTDTCNKCDTTICKTVTVTCACTAKAYFVVDSTNSAGVMYFTNKSSGASFYSWDFGDSSSATSVSPGKHAYKASGSYTICLTVWDANKTCSTKYCVTIKVVKTRSAASSNGISVSVPVNIYPNPASTTFTITTMGYANYEVLDLKGRMITSGNLTNATAINTDGWMNGIYLIRVTNTDGVGTTRLMIQK